MWRCIMGRGRRAPSLANLVRTTAQVALLLTTGLAAVPASHADTLPIPALSAWESNMVTYGRQHCDKLAPGADSLSNQHNNVYYDAERVYYQIVAYTGDPTWRYCAGHAEVLYRDGYVFPNNGTVAGWNNFTAGLLLDFQRTSDAKSREAVLLMSKNAAFARDGTPLEWTAGTDSSREVAYVIMCYLNAEQLGEGRRARLADMINQALGHIDQWFISKTAPYMRPFMVGITVKALIQAYDATKDSRIPPAIATALDGLWTRTWVASASAFMYTDRNAPDGSGGMNPAPDLNLIIAPAYAWMYLYTGDTTYRDRGDQIFEGGVKNAQNYLYLGKQFNQNYWWSPSYVAWRRAATPGSGTGGPVAPPESTDPEPEPTPSPSPGNKGKGQGKKK